MIIWPRLLFGLSVARREIIYRLLKSPGAPLIVRSVKPANLGVGRALAWWARFEFSRINTELTILPEKIEDL